VYPLRRYVRTYVRDKCALQQDRLSQSYEVSHEDRGAQEKLVGQRFHRNSRVKAGNGASLPPKWEIRAPRVHDQLYVSKKITFWTRIEALEGQKRNFSTKGFAIAKLLRPSCILW